MFFHAVVILGKRNLKTDFTNIYEIMNSLNYCYCQYYTIYRKLGTIEIFQTHILFKTFLRFKNIA